MEHLIFCFGACFMGVISLISMLAVYRSNKRVLKDLRHPSQGKDRWLAGLYRSMRNSKKKITRIQNPSVYVVKRMRGRKIGAFSMRQVKEFHGALSSSLFYLQESRFCLYGRREQAPRSFLF